MKLINFFIGLLIFQFLFTYSELEAQDRKIYFDYKHNSKNLTGSVKIDFMVKTWQEQSLRLDNSLINNRIDFTKYPKAQLIIKISGLSHGGHFGTGNLKYKLMVLPSSVPEQVFGFKRKHPMFQYKGGKPKNTLVNNKDYIQIYYEQDLENLNLNYLKDHLWFQLYLVKDNQLYTPDHSWTRSNKFKLKLTPSQEAKLRPNNPASKPAISNNLTKSNIKELEETSKPNFPKGKFKNASPPPKVTIIKPKRRKKPGNTKQQKEAPEVTEPEIQFSVSHTRKAIDSGFNYRVNFFFKGTKGAEPGVDILRNTVPYFEPEWREGAYSIKIESGGEVLFQFTDLETGRAILYPVSTDIPPLVCEQFTIQDDYLIVDQVSGGKPPYSLVFKNKLDAPIASIELEGQTLIEWPLKQLLSDHPELLKATTCTLEDAQGEQFASIDMPPPPTILALKSLFFNILGLLIFSVIGFLAFQWYRKELAPSNKFLEKLQSNMEEGEPVTEPELQTAMVGATSIRSKITVNKKTVEVLENATAISAAPLLADSGDNYFSLDLMELWPSTKVRKVYLHKYCAAQLNAFVFEENDLAVLKGEEIPEIGGFLLGKYQFDALSQQYDISLDQFVEIVPEKNSACQITFGPQAWSQLETKLDSFKKRGLVLVGWFHTHPGHGIFLSKPDLAIQESFFKKPYQVALELDSIERESNPRYSFGLFSWSESGEVNNKAVLKSEWFEWHTVTNWLTAKANV